MPTVRGLLLDIDGTLIDSNDAHARAWVDALAESGRTVAFATVRPLIGMGGDKLLPTVSNLDAETGEGKAISERRGKIFKAKYLPQLQPTRGAEELLATLKHRQIKLAVASSSKADDLRDLLKVCHAEWLVESAATSDDADRSKPDPDILHAAMKNIGLPASDVAMLGDTPYDVTAARKASVRMIALRCGGWSDADLAGADRVFDDPADLAKQLDAVLSQI